MKPCALCVGVIVAVLSPRGFVGPASAQGVSAPRSSAGGESNAFTSGTHSTSSSISFRKDGKLVSIEENGSGLTVTVDGKGVRARDADDLKQQDPAAYRLYVEKPGFAIGSAGGSASASGSQSSRSTRGASPGGLETRGSRSRDRRVTVVDDGKKVTIVENASGITVKVGGKTIRAASAAELKKESAEAFRLYEKHLSKSGARGEGAGAGNALQGDFEGSPHAADLLQEKLREMQHERAGDPRLQSLIQSMLREMAKEGARGDEPLR